MEGTVGRRRWIQTGTLPVKTLGLGDQDVELYERYRRVK